MRPKIIRRIYSCCPSLHHERVRPSPKTDELKDNADEHEATQEVTNSKKVSWMKPIKTKLFGFGGL